MPCQPHLLLLCAILCGSLAAAAHAATVIVDVVPAKMSKEHEQNSESSLAVNPSDPSRIYLSAFGNSAGGNPLFASDTGGSAWVFFNKLATADTSLAWSAGGAAYLSQLSVDGSVLLAQRFSGLAPKIKLKSIKNSFFKPGGGGPDQPWIATGNSGGIDRIYIGFNDLSQPEKTAAMRFSLDGGFTWSSEVIEREVPGDQSDGSAIRTAVHGNTVYAAFQRWNTLLNDGDEQGDLVIVKDIAAGANHFNDLGASGVIVASNLVFPQSNLGQERLGSDLSIAVDPNDGNRVYLATAIVNNVAPKIVVLKSTNGGTDWTQVFSTPSNSALPALAIAGNGTVGLLYTRFTEGNLETHLTQSVNNFTSSSDETLSRFKDNTPVPVFDPYIGDYQVLLAVGDKFYGTFCASNDTGLFPQPVTFLRDKTLLGVSVPFSIDPFFFTSDALAP